METGDKYNEALERARKWYVSNTNEGYRGIFEDIFPELKESEGVKIRKALIKHLNVYTSYTELSDGVTAGDIIAWLEKQGENNPLEEGTFVNVDEVREDFIQEVYRVLDADPTNDRANQIIDAFDNLPTRLIKDVDENAHLWTINDAKPGDIIYAESKFNTFDFIAIFSEIKNKNSWEYCSVDSDSDDYSDDLDHWEFDDHKGFVALDRYNFYPATKKQRHLLYQKMKDAGYEWDADKKELKNLIKHL